MATVDVALKTHLYWKRYYDKLDIERQLMYNAIFEVISQVNGCEVLEPDHKHSIIRRIERSCFNRVVSDCKRDGVDRFWEEPQFKDRYSVFCSKILGNILVDGSINNNVDDKNYLFNQIVSENIDLNHIADLSSNELNPQCNINEIDAINKRKEIQIIEKTSDRKECPVCHEKKTTFKEVQIRSGDEPPSLRYTCVYCKHEWFGG